ncbi:aromatic ring-hydroxylating dioxygenase subunit alpha [Aestuariivirga sp.]|jgi:Rieske 2Fe-2S family protein|uniref:aromatic ring-hydroxylating dioxygenase subunit alpha n=1 Tax=Aestuariivirga sp. TaxID=2650926 RepID=UPI0037832467
MDRHPQSPRLESCPEGLPRAAYMDPAWHEREMATVFARQWVMAGRAADFPAGRIRRVTLGAAPVIVVRDADGKLAAWHNSCPHRGSELCRAEEEEVGRLIRCPYHAFSFAAADGRLVSTGHAVPSADFDRQAHGLKPVSTREWNGFLFLNLSSEPGHIHADVGLGTLDNWPMDTLVTCHRWEADVACNWKVFWENYSECLHCPGIHPELCDMVPVYSRGIMGPSEALGWTPEEPARPNLRSGARTWTVDGAPCGPEFPGLTDAQRQAGYSFVTLWPSAYVVAHVDHVRSVRILPVGTETTRLVAEWHVPADTMAQPGFDAARLASFARTVLEQDGQAAEMNHRGMRSPAFTAARLMPEEYEIYRFHQWVKAAMEDAA